MHGGPLLAVAPESCHGFPPLDGCLKGNSHFGQPGPYFSSAFILMNGGIFSFCKSLLSRVRDRQSD